MQGNEWSVSVDDEPCLDLCQGAIAVEETLRLGRVQMRHPIGSSEIGRSRVQDGPSNARALDLNLFGILARCGDQAQFLCQDVLQRLDLRREHFNLFLGSLRELLLLALSLLQSRGESRENLRKSTGPTGAGTAVVTLKTKMRNLVDLVRSLCLLTMWEHGCSVPAHGDQSRPRKTQNTKKSRSGSEKTSGHASEHTRACSEHH